MNAYSQGYEAARRGYSQQSNPYRYNTSERENWLHGYSTACDNMERESETPICTGDTGWFINPVTGERMR